MTKEGSTGFPRNPAIPPSLAEAHNEIVDLWGTLQEAREKSLFDSLPEACRTECTIAKLVIQRLMQDGSKGFWVREKLAECPAAPKVVGICGTEKIDCSHPESGNTDNFSEQVHNLYEYVQRNELSL